MKIAAVIAEYNPFHNGHRYQLETIRKELGADYIIVIMSGDFMQRGIPAVIDKYGRCQMALENGADVVFELPVYFSLGSAEYFAAGAVSLLDKLGCVDFLHFGSECGDIDALTSCAITLTKETKAYKDALNTALKKGLSFPAARMSALNAVSSPSENILASPNNILGIEYIKALLLRKSPISPATISRTGDGYHSCALESGTFASANAIRELLKTIETNHSGQLSKLQEFVPDTVYKCLCEDIDRFSQITPSRPFVFIDDFSQLLRYKLLSEAYVSPNQLSNCYDVTRQLANTFGKNRNDFTTVSAYILACKSKNLTYTRISRCLMHILLDMKQDTIDRLKASDYCLYARLLGFNQHGQNALKYIKANTSIPIVTKPSSALKKFDKNPDKTAAISLKTDIYASTVYQSVKCANAPFPNELTREIVKA